MDAKEGTKKWRENLVHYSIYLIIGFIILSSLLSFWNRYVTYETRKIIDQAQRTRSLLAAIELTVIDKVTISLQGYLISKEKSNLATYNKALKDKGFIFNELEGILNDQKYPLESFHKLQNSLNEYIDNSRLLLKAIDDDNDSTIASQTNEFLKKQLFRKDHKDFTNGVLAFESKIEEQAQSDYEWSITDNAIIQIILVLLSIPILLIASKRLKSEVTQRNNLLRALDQNNRQYLYDDGIVTPVDAPSIVEKTIGSLKIGSLFIEDIAKGNYEKAQGLIPTNTRALNETTLLGALLRMSSKLQNAEQEDKNRQWVANGLNEFYSIVRNSQHDFGILADKTTSFLTKYLESQQASLFILKQVNGDQYLELSACYAFEKKKWIEKKIDIGTGLVGQVFLEGEPTMLTEVPNGYTQITSGLGHSTPTCVLIVPLRYNEKTEAVFEIARFEKYPQHQIDFLQKAGEFLAAALQNVKTTTEMQTLLRQSQEQAEVLKSQEEELRQNMEELEATNEAMNRREREFNNKL